tara:strand:- start:126 stop:308 length:183 start_codon:yes stop_codon:yes gene_type:complete
MAQVTKRVQSLSQTVQEVEEDICWLQRHTVNGIVPQSIQRELQELQRTRASLVEKQAALV